MNSPQVFTDTADAEGVHRKINGRDILWRGHICEGSDIHPGTRLLWTLCGHDVPTDAAHLANYEDEISCDQCALFLDQEKLDDLQTPR